MGFTLRQATTTDLEHSPEIKSLVEELYQSPLCAPPPEPGTGVQFGYDEVSEAETDEILGPIAKANAPTGVYVDTDPIEQGDFFIFSVPRLSATVSALPPGDNPARQELIDAIKHMAKEPKGDYPIITIWW